ncbi:MAG: threonine synthase, partial [Clostridia bacterium]|nr:threonine synthase [Clostridia bacterium]
MIYQSTRNNELEVKSAEAIVAGLAPDGGLFIPKEKPQISLDDIKRLAEMNYKGRACGVLSLFLSDFTSEEIENCVENAYSKEKFETESIAPLYGLKDDEYILELWHGPTCAFKDMALQILPHLLTTAMKKTGVDKEVVILVATSGDTGKAALEGFADVPGTKIIVFFPDDGV